MTNMIVSKNPTKQDINFMLYNLAFSQTGGKFIVDMLVEEANKHGIKVTEEDVKSVVNHWLDSGILGDNGDYFFAK